MADPFEVRVRFTHQLQRLNASVTSAQKAAAYALKYKDMDEDLHSCILEQLEKNNMNVRANILYFIEHLCDAASQAGHTDFITMVQRDMDRIIDAVAPADGSGAANVKVARNVLKALRNQSVLSSPTESALQSKLVQSARLVDPVMTTTELREPGRSTDVLLDTLDDGGVANLVRSDGGSTTVDQVESLSGSHEGPSQPTVSASTGPSQIGSSSLSAPRSGNAKPGPSNHRQIGAADPTVPPVPAGSTQLPQSSSRHRLDRKQIEQRIEEDRERHKRLRESMWAVRPENEYSRMWDDWGGEAIGEDDYDAARQEANVRDKVLHFV